MNSQNVTNYGSGNISNQYNGDVSLTSLSIRELAQEDRLAARVVRTEKGRRFAWGGVFAAVAVVAIGVGYALFLNAGDLTWTEVFSNLSSALLGPLLGPAISAVVALFSGALAVGSVQNRSEVEAENIDRRRMVEKIVLSKGYTRRQWRNAKKSSVSE